MLSPKTRRISRNIDELMPQSIGKLPDDIIGGHPLKYRRTTDGQFTLYSIGWNGTDDGGQLSLHSYDGREIGFGSRSY